MLSSRLPCSEKKKQKTLQHRFKNIFSKVSLAKIRHYKFRFQSTAGYKASGVKETQLKLDCDTIKIKTMAQGREKLGQLYKASDGDREVMKDCSHSFHKQFEAAVNRQSLIAPRRGYCGSNQS